MVDTAWLGFLVTIASIALFAIAIVLGVLTLIVTVFGKPWLEAEIDRRVQKSIKALENEVMGRTSGYVGFIFGRLRDVRPDFLDAAIDYSRRGYRLLAEETPYKEVVINNLAFYYSLKGNPADAPDAISFGQLLRKRFSDTKDPDYLTTFAGVVATYHGYFSDPRSTLTEAITLMNGLLEDPAVSDPHKQNAQRHLERLRRALADLGKAAT